MELIVLDPRELKPILAAEVLTDWVLASLRLERDQIVDHCRNFLLYATVCVLSTIIIAYVTGWWIIPVICVGFALHSLNGYSKQLHKLEELMRQRERNRKIINV